eukprot:10226600-Alexandrium_andersonii.AAC.1
MSASLVGSEMCIRDRPETLMTTPRLDVRLCWMAVARASCWRNALTQRTACLLYTSDAADDM